MNKIVRPTLLLGFLLIGLAVFAANGWCADKGEHINVAKGRAFGTLNANAWTVYTSMFGPFVYPQMTQTGGGYWGGPTHNYIYGAGMWVGALDAADSPHVSVGYNPNSASSEFGPANPYTWDYANWETDPLSRVYVSTDSADLADWPLRNASNEPIIISQQDGYATYSDENPAFTATGETPVGVRIRQSSYAWGDGFNNDVLYLRFTVINAKPDTLRAVYAGPCFDADIGNEAGGSANDRTDFDYTRNLAIQYQTTPEPGWPSVGYFGCRYLATAVNNTGATVHIVDDQYPHDIAPGEQLGMTAFKIFNIAIDPVTDADRYNEMRSIDYRTSQRDAYDVDTYGPSDKRFIMCSGPFNLAPGDSVTISLGLLAAADRASLLALSDQVQVLYNSGFAGVASGQQHPAGPPAKRLVLDNSPNPFNYGTDIRYQLAAEGPVKLAVYNGLGQLVRTLVDRQLEPGQHAIHWNACNDAGQRLSAGVYLLRLQAGSDVLTKKLVMVK